MKGIVAALVLAAVLGAWLILRKPQTTVAGSAGPAAVVPAAPARPAEASPLGSGVSQPGQLGASVGQSALGPPAQTIVPVRQESPSPGAGKLAESK